MNEKPHDVDNSEKLLESEHGMFALELKERVLKDAEELINASTVGDDIKIKCRSIIQELVSETERCVEKSLAAQTPVADLARISVIKLLDVLGTSNTEQKSLFEALKELIYKARSSALGWQ